MSLAAKVPPHDLGAERAVLGTALLDPECWEAMSGIVEAEDFYKAAHAVIFEAFSALVKNGGAMDVTGLRGQLLSTQKLEHAGGDEYILGLTDTIPTVAFAVHNANRVRSLSVVRGVLKACYELQAKAFGPLDDVGAFLDEAEVAVSKACERRTGQLRVTMMADAVAMSIQNLVTRAESKSGIKGHASGFTGLDWMLSGWNPGDLIVIAGRPAMGKSAFAFDVLRGIVRHTAIPGIMFSLEMPTDQLSDRALSSESRINLNSMRSAQIRNEQWPDLMHAGEYLSDQPIQIIDTPAITVLDIQREVRAFKRRFKECSAVCIDYLQLIRPVTHGRNETRDLQIGEMTRALKAFAKEERVPVILLSQLNRGLESRTDKRPMLSDLRESGSIEQDADTILFVYRDEKYNENSEHKGLAEIIIGKQRMGATGHVMLKFTGEFTRFDNLEEQRSEDSFS